MKTMIRDGEIIRVPETYIHKKLTNIDKHLAEGWKFCPKSVWKESKKQSLVVEETDTKKNKKVSKKKKK